MKPSDSRVSPPPPRCEFEKTGGAWWVPTVAPRPEPELDLPPTDAETLLASRVERNTRLGHFRIPQIPAVAAEAMALLAQPDADPADISAIIHRDQQLAGDIMRFANSALFAGSTSVTNLPQAILRVGFRRARSLIFAASLRAVVYSGSEVARAERLWEHSVGCAAIASRLARNVRRDPDDLYLAGLFHDVGKSVVLALLDTLAMRSQHKGLRVHFVDQVIAEHHERVGAELAIQWNLPDEVVDCIQRHTEADQTPLTPAQAVVTLANNCCHRLAIGCEDDGRAIAGPLVQRALQITDDDLPAVLDGVLEAVALV